MPIRGTQDNITRAARTSDPSYPGEPCPWCNGRTELKKITSWLDNVEAWTTGLCTERKRHERQQIETVSCFRQLTQLDSACIDRNVHCSQVGYCVYFKSSAHVHPLSTIALRLDTRLFDKSGCLITLPNFATSSVLFWVTVRRKYKQTAFGPSPHAIGVTVYL